MGLETLFLFITYLVPLFAWLFSIVFRKRWGFVPIVLLIFASALFLIFLNNRVLFVTARPIVPAMYCMAYLALWTCSLALRKKVPKIILAIILGSFHALLLFGFVLLIWIIGDSLEKPVSQYQVGPISVYSREWGTFAHSGTELVISKRIAGFKAIEKIMYRERSGDSKFNRLAKYDIKRQGQSYRIKIVFEDGRTKTIE